jgi:hypothetical protein
MNWLYSTCRLAHGIHWVLARADGTIANVSTGAFASEEEALRDIGIDHQK